MRWRLERKTGINVPAAVVDAGAPDFGGPASTTPSGLTSIPSASVLGLAMHESGGEKWLQHRENRWP
ncbi:hypothetical protein Pmi06nite_51070 [Planotetraspora mira]|uniref:Uncharacterized protein n=1 Tax=Planotetraspora mira TaxID=58121 RepID=A0A8J3U2K9_9ACTN|nr:hypothetical protein Pmi06nite_51070 [Planotetraspora mira]